MSNLRSIESLPLSFKPGNNNTAKELLSQGVNYLAGFAQSLGDGWYNVLYAPTTSRRPFLRAGAILGAALAAESVGLSVLPKAARAQEEEEPEILGEQIGDIDANLLLPNTTVELTSLENIAQVYGPNLKDWEEAAKLQGKEVWQLIMETQKEYIEKVGEPMPIPAPRKEFMQGDRKVISIETWQIWAKEANMEPVEILLKMFFGTTSKEFLANPSYNRQELEALNELNAVRAAHNLKPAFLDPYATLAARVHAAYLTVNRAILDADPRYHSDKAHIQRRDLFGFTGEQTSDRIRYFKRNGTVWSTDIVGARDTPSENMESWMISPAHNGVPVMPDENLAWAVGYATARVGHHKWIQKGDFNEISNTEMVFSQLKAA